jgi:hypothetical protein
MLRASSLAPPARRPRYLRPALLLPPMSRVLSRLAGALNDIGMNTTGPSKGEPRKA